MEVSDNGNVMMDRQSKRQCKVMDVMPRRLLDMMAVFVSITDACIEHHETSHGNVMKTFIFTWFFGSYNDARRLMSEVG